MKGLLGCFVLLMVACGGKQHDYRKADDALDAGREYLNATMQGDFSRAGFYVLPADADKQVLEELEKQYRLKDKEGRQQFRTASINISEVKEVSDTSTEIHYSYSFDKQPHTLSVIKRNGDWLVDLKKK